MCVCVSYNTLRMSKIQMISVDHSIKSVAAKHFYIFENNLFWKCLLSRYEEKKEKIPVFISFYLSNFQSLSQMFLVQKFSLPFTYTSFSSSSHVNSSYEVRLGTQNDVIFTHALPSRSLLSLGGHEDQGNERRETLVRWMEAGKIQQEFYIRSNKAASSLWTGSRV